MRPFTNMTQANECPICGLPLELKEGISRKNNKPYKLEKCNSLECVDVATGKPFARFINTPRSSKQPQIAQRKAEVDEYTNLMAANRKLYTLIEAGILLHGATPRDLQDKIAFLEEERNK